jgi:peptidoglycan hydrolase CwlO-like protein
MSYLEEKIESTEKRIKELQLLIESWKKQIEQKG